MPKSFDGQPDDCTQECPERVGNDVGDGRVTVRQKQKLSKLNHARSDKPKNARQPEPVKSKAEKESKRNEENDVGCEFNKLVIHKARNPVSVKPSQRCRELRTCRGIDRDWPEGNGCHGQHIHRGEQPQPKQPVTKQSSQFNP